MGDIALRLLNWERDDDPLAPLTDKQKLLLAKLNDATYRPSATANTSSPLPKELLNLNDTTDINYHSLGNLETTHQFLEWFSSVENDMVNEECEKYRKAVSQLKGYSNECTNLLNEVEASLDYLSTLNRQYLLVSNKTNNLHEACEHLLAEQTKLSDTAESISDKLAYFDEVNKISQKLSSPTLSVTNESFIPMLARLDECIAFLRTNARFKESSVYLARFRHCLARALSMIHNYVLKSLQAATQQVVPVKDSQNLHGNAFTLFYVKFRTNAPRIKTLMEQIEIRVSHTHEYQQLLSDCHQCYFAQRNLLITPSVVSAITELANSHLRDHCTLVRSGCNLLLHLSEDEHQLFYQFFSKPSDQL
ncbi:Golgi transport complex subunit 3, partial [Chamberlinius hualienensis]